MTPFQIYLAVLTASLGSAICVLLGVLVNIGVMNAHFERLGNTIDITFQVLESKIEALDWKVEALNRKISSLSVKLEACTARLEAKKRFRRIESHLNLQ